MPVRRSPFETRENFNHWLAEGRSYDEIRGLAWQSVCAKLAAGLRAPFRRLLEEASLETLSEQVALSVEDYSFFPKFLDWCRQCEDEEDPYPTYGVMERDFVGIS